MTSLQEAEALLARAKSNQEASWASLRPGLFAQQSAPALRSQATVQPANPLLDASIKSFREGLRQQLGLLSSYNYSFSNSSDNGSPGPPRSTADSSTRAAVAPEHWLQSLGEGEGEGDMVPVRGYSPQTTDCTSLEATKTRSPGAVDPNAARVEIDLQSPVPLQTPVPMPPPTPLPLLRHRSKLASLATDPVRPLDPEATQQSARGSVPVAASEPGSSSRRIRFELASHESKPNLSQEHVAPSIRIPGTRPSVPSDSHVVKPEYDLRPSELARDQRRNRDSQSQNESPGGPLYSSGLPRSVDHHQPTQSQSQSQSQPQQYDIAPAYIAWEGLQERMQTLHSRILQAQSENVVRHEEHLRVRINQQLHYMRELAQEQTDWQISMIKMLQNEQEEISRRKIQLNDHIEPAQQRSSDTRNTPMGQQGLADESMFDGRMAAVAESSSSPPAATVPPTSHYRGIDIRGNPQPPSVSSTPMSATKHTAAGEPLSERYSSADRPSEADAVGPSRHPRVTGRNGTQPREPLQETRTQELRRARTDPELSELKHALEWSPLDDLLKRRDSGAGEAADNQAEIIDYHAIRKTIWRITKQRDETFKRERRRESPFQIDHLRLHLDDSVSFSGSEDVLLDILDVERIRDQVDRQIEWLSFETIREVREQAGDILNFHPPDSEAVAHVSRLKRPSSPQSRRASEAAPAAKGPSKTSKKAKQKQPSAEHSVQPNGALQSIRRPSPPMLPRAPKRPSVMSARGKGGLAEPAVQKRIANTRNPVRTDKTQSRRTTNASFASPVHIAAPIREPKPKVKRLDTEKTSRMPQSQSPARAVLLRTSAVRPRFLTEMLSRDLHGISAPENTPLVKSSHDAALQVSPIRTVFDIQQQTTPPPERHEVAPVPPLAQPRPVFDEAVQTSPLTTTTAIQVVSSPESLQQPPQGLTLEKAQEIEDLRFQIASMKERQSDTLRRQEELAQQQRAELDDVKDKNQQAINRLVAEIAQQKSSVAAMSQPPQPPPPPAPPAPTMEEARPPAIARVEAAVQADDTTIQRATAAARPAVAVTAPTEQRQVATQYIEPFKDAEIQYSTVDETSISQLSVVEVVRPPPKRLGAPSQLIDHRENLEVFRTRQRPTTTEESLHRLRGLAEERIISYVQTEVLRKLFVSRQEELVRKAQPGVGSSSLALSDIEEYADALLMEVVLDEGRQVCRDAVVDARVEGERIGREENIRLVHEAAAAAVERISQLAQPKAETDPAVLQLHELLLSLQAEIQKIDERRQASLAGESSDRVAESPMEPQRIQTELQSLEAERKALEDERRRLEAMRREMKEREDQKAQLEGLVKMHMLKEAAYKAEWQSRAGEVPPEQRRGDLLQDATMERERARKLEELQHAQRAIEERAIENEHQLQAQREQFESVCAEMEQAHQRLQVEMEREQAILLERIQQLATRSAAAPTTAATQKTAAATTVSSLTPTEIVDSVDPKHESDSRQLEANGFGDGDGDGVRMLASTHVPHNVVADDKQDQDMGNMLPSEAPVPASADTSSLVMTTFSMPLSEGEVLSAWYSEGEVAAYPLRSQDTHDRATAETNHGRSLLCVATAAQDSDERAAAVFHSTSHPTIETGEMVELQSSIVVTDDSIDINCPPVGTHSSGEASSKSKTGTSTSEAITSGTEMASLGELELSANPLDSVPDEHRSPSSSSRGAADRSRPIERIHQESSAKEILRSFVEEAESSWSETSVSDISVDRSGLLEPGRRARQSLIPVPSRSPQTRS
ncbi:uncharacterized protein BJ171DRAFT_278444 [Polychytrium aggregatum]|uniref:uncharacterized protein n=1 Tax=Polychytrium aggregatum TaxID=110093 RepID=UPI0022FDB349|nr:uncharacterized protein BJ171DRAFT_278444 [Polychytrium aggregatum]KAI9207619.1 hypothetical protein BJ171DRAFT_278444 [Polychytrium aggregatum]